MVAPYSIRIHPFSRIPAKGDRGFLLRVEGSTEHLFSRTPAGPSERPLLYGPAPKVLGLAVEAEGACAVVEIEGPYLIRIRPLSDAETRDLLASGSEAQGA